MDYETERTTLLVLFLALVAIGLVISARAAALTPERRRQIARAGWLALVDKRFDGNASEAARYIGKVGAWASDAPYRDTFPVFQHPGPMPGGDDLTSEKGDMAWQQ